MEILCPVVLPATRVVSARKMVADFLALSIDRLGSLLVQLERRGMIKPCPPQGLRLVDVVALENLAGRTLSTPRRSFECQANAAGG